MTTTEVQQTIARQFTAIGPRVLNNGHTRFLAATFGLDDGVTVTFQFRAARKRKGALLPDMTGVHVSYDAGADLYDVTITPFDGAKCENGTPRVIKGLDVECLANLTA